MPNRDTGVGHCPIGYRGVGRTKKQPATGGGRLLPYTVSGLEVEASTAEVVHPAVEGGTANL